MGVRPVVIQCLERVDLQLQLLGRHLRLCLVDHLQYSFLVASSIHHEVDKAERALAELLLRVVEVLHFSALDFVDEEISPYSRFDVAVAHSSQDRSVQVQELVKLELAVGVRIELVEQSRKQPFIV